MRTKNTRFSPNTAVRRLEKWAKRGTHGYHNQRLRLADNAYQPKGNRTSTALRQWQRAKKPGLRASWQPPAAVRRADVLADLEPAGHIATYVGNGKAVTNMPGGRSRRSTGRR